MAENCWRCGGSEGSLHRTCRGSVAGHERRFPWGVNTARSGSGGSWGVSPGPSSTREDRTETAGPAVDSALWTRAVPSAPRTVQRRRTAVFPGIWKGGRPPTRRQGSSARQPVFLEYKTPQCPHRGREQEASTGGLQPATRALGDKAEPAREARGARAETERKNKRTGH
ncbi:hypothetical protein NDU88_002348 [Pleurodeles waltl]|uniref:Uncharacterized protein n=1 Tax=Pleurodeles waltl TaxID=8319 RepID=A0AAV7R9S3_PLEWA|nr:hypothetical protein NDU88_002348 [Pleurodeles waltl]